jgi:two-component system, LuxR family, response regulator FixJ
MRSPGVDFGCVLSDVRMPGIDGIELLKRLKANSSTFPLLIQAVWKRFSYPQ